MIMVDFLRPLLCTWNTLQIRSPEIRTQVVVIFNPKRYQLHQIYYKLENVCSIIHEFSY